MREETPVSLQFPAGLVWAWAGWEMGTFRPCQLFEAGNHEVCIPEIEIGDLILSKGLPSISQQKARCHTKVTGTENTASEETVVDKITTVQVIPENASFQGASKQTQHPAKFWLCCCQTWIHLLETSSPSLPKQQEALKYCLFHIICTSCLDLQIASPLLTSINLTLTVVCLSGMSGP